jgi:hypothetical protein
MPCVGAYSAWRGQLLLLGECEFTQLETIDVGRKKRKEKLSHDLGQETESIESKVGNLRGSRRER